MYFLSSKQNTPEGIEIVKYLISKGADINFSCKNYGRDNINASCLDYVISQSKTEGWESYYTELFNILYEEGAKISDYSFSRAISANNAQIIDTLVKSGKVNKQMYSDGLYMTVLNVYDIQVENAIKYIELFIENGADINYKGASGSSPLMTSVTMFGGDVDTRIMKYLVENGADRNTTDKDGNTIFMNFSRSHYESYKDKIELYLNSKPNINIKNKNKQTAISHFIEAELYPEKNYDKEQEKKIFEKLIKLNPDFFDNDVETPYIILAAKNHKNDIAKYLIEIGVDVNIQDNKGKNALYYAYNTEDEELINMLKNPEVIRQAKIEQLKAEQKKKEDISIIELIIKDKDFEELKSIMDSYRLTSDFKLSTDKSIYETVFDYFIKDNDKLYIDYIIQDKNYSNIKLSFNEDEKKWYYSIDTFEKRLDAFEDIQSDNLREYLKKEIDKKFERNYNNLKEKKSNNKIYYSYIDSKGASEFCVAGV